MKIQHQIRGFLRTRQPFVSVVFGGPVQGSGFRVYRIYFGLVFRGVGLERVNGV